MKEKNYQDYLNNYREGTEFLLRTDRGNGIIENIVVLKYDSNEGLKIPHFHSVKGDAIFNPRLIGGIENIISIEEIADGMC